MPVNINRRGEAQHILLEFPHTERIDVTVKETDIRAIVMDEVYGRILIERPRQEEAEGFSRIELRIIDDERNSRGIFQPPYDICQTGQLKRSADRVIAEERFQPDRIIPAVGTEISGVNTVGDKSQTSESFLRFAAAAGFVFAGQLRFFQCGRYFSV